MNDFIDYKKIIPGYENFLIAEKKFLLANQGKFETILSQGNGYYGLRAVTEESYSNRHYGLFISGTFNTPGGDEVSELPNGADIINMEFKINGENFSLVEGQVLDYQRVLNMKTGELTRSFTWVSLAGNKLRFEFKRFTSFADYHLLIQEVKVIPLNNDVEITFTSGINGQTTNSGTQHFIDYDAHCYQEEVLQYVFQTEQSKENFYYNRCYEFKINNVKNTNIKKSLISVYGYDRRKLLYEYDFNAKKNQEIVISSFSSVHTSYDYDFDKKIDYKKYLQQTAEYIMACRNEGYDMLFKKHLVEFEHDFSDLQVKIDSKNNFDQLAVNFALYNLRKFTPWHDATLNIEAKGLVGEEYKGHTFWDTEIYILPFYIFNNPKIALQLLKHRYTMLPSAHKKAQAFNTKGAMWPWETSRKDDGETCPTWGEVDIKVGDRIKVWPAFNELHISSDIVWAIQLYYYQTQDQEFMDNYGYEMVFDTALFWLDKIVYNKEKDQYEILAVTGPNEYKENIDNNVFTNYMTYNALDYAYNLYEKLKSGNSELFTKLMGKVNLQPEINKLKEVLTKLYLPQPNNAGIIPENDTFLQLKTVPKISEYKKLPGSIWKDYTSNELNDYQVLKQADLVALFYTLPTYFNEVVVLKNWYYYEQNTLHSSSLSLSMHSTTAAKIKNKDLAYNFFQKACCVDLGDNMNSSNNGIHAAAVGGILKTVVEGFGGVSNNLGKLIINPFLPEEWNKLEYTLNYCGVKFNVVINQEKITVTVVDKIKQPISLYVKTTKVIFDDNNKIYQGVY